MNTATSVSENTSINQRFKTIRKENQLSQVELAKRLGVSQSVVSLIESGHSSVSVEVLKKLSHEFDLSADWLIFGGANFEKISTRNGYIPLVHAEAKAGYLTNHNEENYPDTLALYKIPGFEDGDFRIFLVDGDSMLPSLHPHDKLVCQRFPEGQKIVDGSLYVMVTTKNILVKRLYTSQENPDFYVLRSDNHHYPEDKIDNDEVKEIWEVKTKLTSSFVDDTFAQTSRISGIEEDISDLKEALQELTQTRRQASE